MPILDETENSLIILNYLKEQHLGYLISGILHIMIYKAIGILILSRKEQGRFIASNFHPKPLE
jgi:hypothetical protein